MGYHSVPLSPLRRLAIDLLQVSHGKHPVHGLIEVDVTTARCLIREHARRTGEKLSFTGFVIACVARAVAENPTLNAIRSGRRVILYDQVNVGTMVERTVGGELAAAPYMVKAADRKSVREITEEIRGAQAAPLEHRRELALGGVSGWIFAVPAPVRRALIRTVIRIPKLAGRLGGTVAVTAIGMFGDGMGWGIPMVPSTLAVTVGGIGRHPCLEAGVLCEHEFLCLTLTFDHDLVDGAPAARFAARLRELLEAADVLREG